MLLIQIEQQIIQTIRFTIISQCNRSPTRFVRRNFVFTSIWSNRSKRVFSMTALQNYFPKFNLQYSDNDWSNLHHELKNNTEVVKFHLRCALAAYDQENSLRYLPRPPVYLKDITNVHVEDFLNRFRDNVDESVSRLIGWVNSRTNNRIIPLESIFSLVSLKILYFTLFTCDVYLLDCSYLLTTNVKVFVAQCSEEKEKEFNAIPGNVTYLMHRTTQQCLYSICRNGIKSMSHEQRGGFQTTGAQYGAGIYLSDPGVYAHHGESTLCYAVKNAERYKTGQSNIYVTQEANICLRAVVWDVQNMSNNTIHDWTIIDCIKQHYCFPKLHTVRK